MLIVALPFNISIVYSIYDKFTISKIIQLSLCRLLVHVLMIKKGAHKISFVLVYGKRVLIFLIWKYVDILQSLCILSWRTPTPTT